MKNDNLINNITGKVSLFNKHDTYTNEGRCLSNDFDNLIKRFVTDAHEKYSSQEIDNILTTCVQMLCCDVRIEQGVKLAKKIRKEKTEAHTHIARKEMENIISWDGSEYWEYDKPRLIPIIKRIRDVTGWNLRDSKDYVHDFFKKNNIQINT